VNEEAMKFFGDPYPRKQEEREEQLDRLSGESREEWNPFVRLEEKFYELVAEGRFDRAADEYARKNSV
jgi:hypothetical protein